MQGADHFPQGVVVFFRILAGVDASGVPTIARSVHITGRKVTIGMGDGHQDDYIVFDEEDRLLGVYPRDWVSAIMPLITIGPNSSAPGA